MNDADLEQSIANRIRARIVGEPLVETQDDSGPATSDREVTPPEYRNGRLQASDESSHPAKPAQPEPIADWTETRIEQLGDAIHERFVALKSTYETLAGELQEAIVDLKERGIPASFPLQNALAQSHREFLKLRREILGKLAAGLQPEPFDKNRLKGLADLSEWIDRLPASPVPPVVPSSTPPAAIAPEPPVIADRQPTPEPEPEPVIAVEEPPAVVEEAIAPVDSSVVSETSVEDPVDEAGASSSVPPTVIESAVDDDPVRAEAEDIVDRFLRIQLKPGKAVPEFDEALIEACSLKRRIVTTAGAEPSSEILDLIEGRHPISAFVTLIEQTGQLSDADWGELHSKVAEGLGRAIAMAAARDRFVADPAT